MQDTFISSTAFLGIIISTSIFISKFLLQVFSKQTNAEISNLKETSKKHEDNLKRIEEDSEVSKEKINAKFDELLEKLNSYIENLNKISLSNLTAQKDLYNDVSLNKQRIKILEREIQEIKNEKK